MIGRVLRYWAWPALSVLLILQCGGADPRAPGEGTFSKLQQELLARMGGAGKSAPETPVLLSLQLASVIAEMRGHFGDSIVAPDGPFWVKLDSVSLALSSKLFMEDDPNVIVNLLNRYVFTSKGFSFDRNRSNIQSMFPHSVEQNSAGSCVGLSLLYLLLAEKLGVQLYGVLVPGHFFVRFDNGTDQINIETMKQGKNMPDSWYREKYEVPESTGVYLRNLSTSEVMAVVHYNIANVLAEFQKLGPAISHYTAATRLLPGFAEAWGNLGIAYDRSGDAAKALEALQTAQRVWPGLPNSSRNIGALLNKTGQYQAAADEYGKALEKDAYDPDLLYGLGIARLHLGDKAKARESFTAALSVRSNFADAKAMLEKVNRDTTVAIRGSNSHKAN